MSTDIAPGVTPGPLAGLPARQTGIGMIVPYDMALDSELWRWAPNTVTLFFTRTPYAPMAVGVAQAEAVADNQLVAASVRDLSAVSPAIYAYGCTSGSFIRGLAGERQLVAMMTAAGAPAAVTTSGALLSALEFLGSQRVAIATPYNEELTRLLAAYLAESAGIRVVGSRHLGLTGDVWKVSYPRTEQLIRQANTDDADAIVVSCTNLPSYDIIAPLESELGKPVLTANQATIWAALRRLGQAAIGPGQRLIESGPAATPAVEPPEPAGRKHGK